MRGMKTRRLTGIIVALAMMITQVSPVVVHAEKDESKPVLKIESEAQAASEKQETAEENTAVVLFKDKGEITKSEVKADLKQGESSVKDVKVEDVWNFVPEESGSGKKLAGEEETTGIAVVSSESLSTKELVKKLNARDDVDIAEPNYKIHMLSVTNDPYSDYQWSMQDDSTAPNVSAQWNGSTEGAHGGASGSDKIVAIVDTGIDYTHPDLKNMLWENNHYPELKGEYGYDFINGDDDPMDDNGHGSHCAGIIGAQGDNGAGISGVNKNIKIMALKILDYEGSAYLSHEIAAYNYINSALDLGEPVVAINNSWGGGEPSKIMERLIDIVGEKGAVTVCAAGNESSDNDENPVYPASIESQYLISVGAYNEYGKMASYSNYGDSVDVAAPGSDILSSVSYESYNPTIYGDKQNEISSEFNDLSDEANKWAVPGTEADAEYPIYIDGEKYSDYVAGLDEGDEGTEITVERQTEKGFLGKDTGHIKINFKNMSDSSIAGFEVPYEVVENWKTDPKFSLVVRASGPEDGYDFFGAPLFGLVDMPADAPLSLNSLNKVPIVDATYVIGEGDDWIHLATDCYLNRSGEDDKNRKVTIFLYAYTAGDYTIELDDIGMSDPMLESSEAFGKYDFMSGTSMATPYVTGSIALKAAAMGDGYDPNVAINEITTQSRTLDPENEFPVASRGALYFGAVPGKGFPKIKNVVVDAGKNNLVISGAGFGDDKSTLRVQLKDPGEEDTEYKDAEIVDAADKSITIVNDKLINNVKDIKITRGDGKTATKKNVYLVGGKEEYSPQKNVYFDMYSDYITTDGQSVYTASRTNSEITKVDPKNSDNMDSYTIELSELFSKKKDPNKQYGMMLPGGIAVTGGSIYTVVEYGALDESETSDDDIIWLSHGTAYDEYDEDDDEDETPENYSLYSSDFRLACIKTSNGSTTNLGELPDELKKTVGWTLASYNGKLLFIGGYSFGSKPKGLTDQVWIFDPAKKTWAKGASLPEKRGGGKAVQIGDKLVYTLGYSEAQNGVMLEEQEYPANLIYDGKTWVKSEAKTSLKPLVQSASVTVGGNEYLASDVGVGITADGLLYMGCAMKDLGDTFVYDLAKDDFADTGYNFASNPEEVLINSVVVGNTAYGYYDEIYTIPVKSALINVKGTKTGNGKITGARGYMPGDTAVVTIKANKNNHIKSIKLNGKTVKVKNKTKQTITIPKLLKDQTVKVTFAKDVKYTVKVTKKGKGTVKGAGKYYKGKNVKITAKASKGYYIKTFKVGTKSIKVGKKVTKKVYTIKKIKKNTKVKVVFAKK